jgi:hypothetical protein
MQFVDIIISVLLWCNFSITRPDLRAEVRLWYELALNDCFMTTMMP